MELMLNRIEVHVLRDTLEKIVVNLEKEIVATEEPKALGELVERKGILKTIVEILPVEFAFVA